MDLNAVASAERDGLPDATETICDYCSRWVPNASGTAGICTALLDRCESEARLDRYAACATRSFDWCPEPGMFEES